LDQAARLDKFRDDINRSIVDNSSHEPLNKVIHDAFKTMERQLRHLVEKQRGE
jgi:hypothetical protein